MDQQTVTTPLFKPSDVIRKRLMKLGPSALTDAELVSLTLDGPDAFERAGALLDEGLYALLQEAPESLLEYRQLSLREVNRLAAAGELARRLDERFLERTALDTPDAIYAWSRAQFLGLRREEFHVICLNSKHRVLRRVRVAEGAVDQCVVDPREVLAPAVVSRATSVVLLHNHPSGDPEPSVQDVALTRQLRDACRLLCIRLVDHLVIGDRGYVSMLSRGLLRPDELPEARVQSP